MTYIASPKGQTNAANSTPVVVANDQLPPAQTLSDGYANPTLSLIGSFLHGFGGITWDRLRAGLTTVSNTFTGILNTVPWAVFNTTPTTRTDGYGGPLQSDSLGSLLVSQGTKLAGEDLTNDVMKVEQQMSWVYITAAAPTNTTVKSGAGFLHAIIINTTTAGGVISVYDALSATNPIAIITQPGTVLDTSYVLTYDIKFNTGLFIVTSGAAQNITVSYR